MLDFATLGKFAGYSGELRFYLSITGNLLVGNWQGSIDPK